MCSTLIPAVALLDIYIYIQNVKYEWAKCELMQCIKLIDYKAVFRRWDDKKIRGLNVTNTFPHLTLLLT